MKKLEDFLADGYIPAEDKLPFKDGRYQVIWHTGSMSPKLKEGYALFTRGKFPRFDWDYVAAWKERK